MVAVVQSISLLTVLTSSVSCRRRLWRSSSMALFSLRIQLMQLPWPILKSSKASALDGGELSRDNKPVSHQGRKTTPSITVLEHKSSVLKHSTDKTNITHILCLACFIDRWLWLLCVLALSVSFLWLRLFLGCLDGVQFWFGRTLQTLPWNWTPFSLFLGLAG